MRSIHTLFAALLFTVGAGAQAAVATNDFRQCSENFAEGRAPTSASFQQMRTRALCYNSFAVLHSGVTKTPLFAAEKLNRDVLLDARGEKRHDKFFADARLPRAERAELEDYRGSGLDRGHLAAAANRANPDAMAQSFSLANIVPQARVNNQRTWAKLEKDTRQYAMRARGDVYVISGPVFQSNETIGPNRVRVPSHLYKLVYDAQSGRAWAHWLENTDEARAGRPITYKELVQRTGIEFLPGIAVRN